MIKSVKKTKIILSMLKKISLILLLGLTASCAHNSTTSSVANDGQYTNDGDLDSFRIKPDASSGQPTAPKVEELEVIPDEMNANVQKWVNYFQGRGREHMEKYLLRSTRYEALMKKVLRDNKLPEDLFYIALIESGFSSQAFSHASAVGYWQFIRPTGKRYKLKINKWQDDRRDPVMSTQAAADYFKDLYARFDSWFLSMAAYNVGEGRVERVIKKYKTRNFWELSAIKKALPKETDEYVPKFIAAKLIAKSPDKYGFEGLDYLPPIEFDHITSDQPVNLRVMADKMNINYEDFKALNPKFKGEVAPLEEDKSLGLRIPPGTYEIAQVAVKDSIADPNEFIADKDEFQNYKVRRNDSLATIARKYRTTVAFLRDINDFPRKKKLKVGRSILVPDRTPLVEKRPALVAKSKRSKNSDKGQKKFHIVKSGENLAIIARKYDVSLATLKKVNNLKSKSKLKLGTKLVLPEKKNSEI